MISTSAATVAASESLSLKDSTDSTTPKSIDSNCHASEALVSVAAVIGKIVAVSERLFPGPVSIEYAIDPEDTSHQWLDFEVTVAVEYADYRDRKSEWYKEVARIVPGSLCEFRLRVVPLR